MKEHSLRHLHVFMATLPFFWSEGTLRCLSDTVVNIEKNISDLVAKMNWAASGELEFK